MTADDEARAERMRASFEAELPSRLRRAACVDLQQVIPSHWFSNAASECLTTYVGGAFYSSISVAQAYVEALSKFLCEVTLIKCAKNSAEERWVDLHEERVVTTRARDAALRIWSSDRNDFHHLNKWVEQDHSKLEALAEQCVNDLHAIESEVFAYSFGEPGKITPRTPAYWPTVGEGDELMLVRLRHKV